ncbi:hypothetical protein [Chryseolinea lacunae]|uniref:Uncharacterized protein n=1 Tax=Chryseolinea lacunae TaxID=2801331 RepID=A0ABS1L1R0_9BACT|nr:hypothetical protein [Chryseolinea lacunae]MBL0745649.1 hypothetical protein [Chryseolinea lacunae]
MFGLFKKKKAENTSDYLSDVALLKQIFSAMGSNFAKFHQQLEAGLIVGSKKRDTPVPGYVSFAYNTDVLNRFEDKKGRNLAIRGIKVFEATANAYVEIQINVGYGIVMGFFPKLHPLTSPVLDNVQVDRFTIHYPGEDNFNPAKALLSKEDAQLINPSDVYELELNGKKYYHLADLENGDGDFVGIDDQKNLYRITHDPFEITVVNGSLAEILGKQ